MATKRVLPDKDFDRIIVRTHKLARNVTMRVKPDGLHVTVPPYSLSSKVLEVVEQYRQRLLEDWRKVSKKPIDLNFRIHTPCFRLWLEQGNFTCFSVRFTEEGVKSMHIYPGLLPLSKHSKIQKGMIRLPIWPPFLPLRPPYRNKG